MDRETQTNMNEQKEDKLLEGRKKKFMDIDRMVNDGLGGGQITDNDSGLIEKGAGFPKKESEPTINGEKLPDAVLEGLNIED